MQYNESYGESEMFLNVRNCQNEIEDYELKDVEINQV